MYVIQIVSPNPNYNLSVNFFKQFFAPLIIQVWLSYRGREEEKT